MKPMMILTIARLLTIARSLTVAFFLTIACLVTASTVTAQAQNKNSEQEFMRLQRAEDDAETKKDVAALDRLLNDDFIFVAPNGSVSDKKKFLDDVKGNDEPSSAAQETLTY